jgi:hypothetical protein
MRLGQTNINLARPMAQKGWVLRRDVWLAHTKKRDRSGILRAAGINANNHYRLMYRPYRIDEKRQRLAGLLGMGHDELWVEVFPADMPLVK